MCVRACVVCGDVCAVKTRWWGAAPARFHKHTRARTLKTSVWRGEVYGTKKTKQAKGLVYVTRAESPRAGPPAAPLLLSSAHTDTANTLGARPQWAQGGHKAQCGGWGCVWEGKERGGLRANKMYKSFLFESGG